MGISIENIKRNFPILIVKFALLSLFIASLIMAIRRFSITYADPILIILRLLLDFKYVILLSIVLFGVFSNKKLGWIIVQSYFYLYISDIFFTAYRFYDWFGFETVYYVYYILNILLALLLIVLMNNKICTKTFGIEKKDLILKNVVAFAIGVSLMLAFFFLESSFFRVAISRIK